ncbi:response regulator [Photobacterium satsumensis]|uniref:response regulator n=1 Tax=Photobacterium satsumensis TaxID=2910239 RepID=UPI003D0C05FD
MKLLITKVPPHFLWAIISISILPFLLHIAGVDFSSNYASLDVARVEGLSSPEIRDYLFYVLSGSIIHTLLEWTSICIAVVTVVLAFVHFQIKKDVVTPIIGVALFTAGCLDIFHTLAADRLISATAPNQDFIPFTWAISRLFNATITMAGVTLLLLRGKQKASLSFVLGVSVTFGVIAYAIVVYCATQAELPQTIYPDALITRPWDIGPLCLFLICGFWLYPKLYHREPSLFTQALWLSLIPQVMTELHMAFGSVAIFDSHFNIAHFLKIIAYAVPFCGLILDYLQTYKSKLVLEQALFVEKNKLEEKVKVRTSELKQSEEMMRTVIVTALDAVIMIDRKGRILEWNQNAGLTYGWAEKEIMGKSIFDIIDIGVEEDLNQFYEFLETGQGFLNNNRIEMSAWHKDGTKIPIEISMTPIRKDDSFIFNSFSRDISERKNAEQAQLRLIDEADKANRAKSDFLAVMSHEIRTPMNAIIGMSHLTLQTNLDPKQRNYIEKVHSSADNLLSIINDILDFSKIEAGKLEIEKRSFRLEDIFDNTANLIGLIAEEKGVELIFSMKLDLPRHLIGDETRLKQILINLANNAIKFTDKGEILIGVEEKSRNNDGIELHFWVKDSGIGIDEELIKRLFKSFSQADSSTTRQYGGTGLGLAISKQLVEMMDGRIWVESTVGQGATFHFVVKLGMGGNALSRRALHIEELKGLRVLVVDDNPCASEVITSMLQSFGLVVESVGDSHEAINVIVSEESQATPFDLVLLDWKMPENDGISIVRRLQEYHQSSTPIVIMGTAYSRDEMLHQLDKCGLQIQSILTKPVTPSSLLEVVSDAFGKQVDVTPLRLKRAVTSHEVMKKLAGMKVLLVEDNEINQELAKELLRQAEMEVVVAENGQQALDILNAIADVDCILMDCQMPVMDGYQATREIRKINQFENIPILAMTANAMVGDKDKALQAGMNDHISKPLNIELMYETMAKWIVPSSPKPNYGTAKKGNSLRLNQGRSAQDIRYDQVEYSELLSLISLLRECLESNDTTADEVLDEMKGSPHCIPFSGLMNELEENLSLYDFDSALIALVKLERAVHRHCNK